MWGRETDQIVFAIYTAFRLYNSKSNTRFSFKDFQLHEQLKQEPRAMSEKEMKKAQRESWNRFASNVRAYA